MAKPSTRQELIDYSLRKLGAPVLEINVDDDQIDDLVDDAIQLFQDRHFDGVEKMYLKYELTQNDIDRGRANETQGEVLLQQQQLLQVSLVMEQQLIHFKNHLILYKFQML